jgi:hypothetical protein
MATSVKDLINKATERANNPQPKKSGKPVFLFFKPGQKALIRPMFKLDDCLTFQFHNKWNDDPQHRVNAICAKEIGKTCQHCQAAKEDKKLRAGDTVYVPVYVYHVIDVATGQKVTYKDKDEDDNEVMKLVTGFRMLELTLFGKPLAILQAFLSHERDEDLITTCDFNIEQTSAGQSKNFLVTPKAPKPVNPKVQEACPGIDKFHEAILGARPPLVAGDDAIDGFVHAVNAQVVEEVSNDNIPVF